PVVPKRPNGPERCAAAVIAATRPALSALGGRSAGAGLSGADLHPDGGTRAARLFPLVPASGDLPGGTRSCRGEPAAVRRARSPPGGRRGATGRLRADAGRVDAGRLLPFLCPASGSDAHGAALSHDPHDLLPPGGPLRAAAAAVELLHARDRLHRHRRRGKGLPPALSGSPRALF